MSTVASRITRRYAWYALVVLFDRPSRALPRRRRQELDRESGRRGAARA